MYIFDITFTRRIKILKNGLKLVFNCFLNIRYNGSQEEFYYFSRVISICKIVLASNLSAMAVQCYSKGRQEGNIVLQIFLFLMLNRIFN